MAGNIADCFVINTGQMTSLREVNVEYLYHATMAAMRLLAPQDYIGYRSFNAVSDNDVVTLYTSFFGKHQQFQEVYLSKGEAIEFLERTEQVRGRAPGGEAADGPNDQAGWRHLVLHKEVEGIHNHLLRV